MGIWIVIIYYLKLVDLWRNKFVKKVFFWFLLGDMGKSEVSVLYFFMLF